MKGFRAYSKDESNDFYVFNANRGRNRCALILGRPQASIMLLYKRKCLPSYDRKSHKLIMSHFMSIAIPYHNSMRFRSCHGTHVSAV